MSRADATRRRRVWRLLGVVASALALAACEQTVQDDLDGYVARIKSRPGEAPERLPPVKVFETFSFSPPRETDPFKSFLEIEAARRAAAVDNTVVDLGAVPDFDRNKEELESFALDSLRMMGTMQQDGELWAIIRSPDSVLHRVQSGNYLGQNFGEIKNISETQLDVTERVQDERGRWAERDAGLSMAE